MKRSALPVLFTLFAASVAMAQPVLEITKSCPRLRYLGREATFDISVTNKGNQPAQNVVITDTITGAVDFLSADNNGSREGNNVVWRLPTLAAGQTVTMKVMLRCSAIGTIRNNATVTWCSEAAASCEMEVKGIPAILLECVDSPDPVEVGTQTTYTITVTNQGTETGTNITVNCTLPPEQEFVQAAGATPGSNEGAKVTFSALATLAPKAQAVWTVTSKGVRAGDSRFRIDMKSDQIDSPVSETEATRVYE